MVPLNSTSFRDIAGTRPGSFSGGSHPGVGRFVPPQSNLHKTRKLMRFCKALRVPGADGPPGGTRRRIGPGVLPLAATVLLAGVGVAQAAPVQLQLRVSAAVEKRA
jgi:hypothetical protein